MPWKRQSDFFFTRVALCRPRMAESTSCVFCLAQAGSSAGASLPDPGLLSCSMEMRVPKWASCGGCETDLVCVDRSLEGTWLQKAGRENVKGTKGI